MTNPQPIDPRAVLAALSAPFHPDEVEAKPTVVSGNRALAVFYIDARVVMDRLDAVLGVDGWQDDYEFLADGAVVCRLRCRLGTDWLTKVDVGSPSEQPDKHDRVKAAVSDALKRAAVKFGVGRYLYRVPSQWVDYDPKARKFTRAPKLPAWALPAPTGKPQEQPKAPPAETAPSPTAPPETITRDQAADLFAVMKINGVPAQCFRERYHVASLSHLPADRFSDCRNWASVFKADGIALEQWLAERDEDLARRGKVKVKELIEHVQKCAREAGEKRPMAEWPADAVRHAISVANQFVQQCYGQTPAGK